VRLDDSNPIHVVLDQDGGWWAQWGTLAVTSLFVDSVRGASPAAGGAVARGRVPRQRLAADRRALAVSG